MRRLSIYGILAIMALAGCQTKELDNTPQRESKPFSATIEDSFDDDETRTYLDEHGNVLWKRGDHISIFAGSTLNEQYQVTDDSEGKTAASLNRVTDPGFVAGGEIDNNVAFYPYTSTATIARNESAYVISDITLPAIQNYAEASFGNGAFPMAAVTSDTEDMRLKFKNVLGGLKLQLKGTARIKSIKVTGNQDEILCGAAAVTVSTSSTPSINLTDATAKVVALDCGEGVQLDAETATPFVIALPPMTMEGGFTVLVTDTEGKQMEIPTTKSQTIKRSTLLKMPSVDYEGSVKSMPLTFTSSGETNISLTKVGFPDDISLEYKINNGDWREYLVGGAITLSDGGMVSFRAGTSGNASFSHSYDDYYHFSISGSGTIAASGSIMSLLNQRESVFLPSTFSFYELFSGCTLLTSAPDLPATALAAKCYASMFKGCTSLTIAPKLPATKLETWCYAGMFEGCTSLTIAPELPATTLVEGCYSGMFKGCTSLTIAPELPATALAEECYPSMFVGCTSLTTTPKLPATTLAKGCYSAMFYGCTSLTSAPDLPAIILAQDCYSVMFYGCTNLTSTSELPASILAPGCYSYMFYECTSLTIAPELPATSLSDYCYDHMFYGCTSLTVAPELPATSLARYCYRDMFYGCTSLTSAPELPATVLAEGCYRGMFSDCSCLTIVSELPATTLAKDCYGYMFQHCTRLATAPAVLPATSLASYCYRYMFTGCISLTTAPELPAITLVSHCYDNMFNGCITLNYVKALFITTPIPSNHTSFWLCDVSDTGTFVKNKDATWDLIGDHGIPSGWTVLTE